MKQITKKIADFSVKKELEAVVDMLGHGEVKSLPELEIMSSAWKRPEKLLGATYKIEKSPNSPDAAVYITINNEILNKGTEFQTIIPAEIFINSKDVSHLQWITALTRVLSAVFRKGGEIEFLVDELCGIHDPKAGFLRKGRFYPSLVAQVGLVIKEHLEELKETPPPILVGDSNLKAQEVSEFIESEFGGLVSTFLEEELSRSDSHYPPTATLCPKCLHKSVMVLDGCQTCLNCLDSKCS